MKERPATVDLKQYSDKENHSEDQEYSDTLSPDEEALVEALVDYWIRCGSRMTREAS